ncbi:MAG: TonB-dependent receptor [Longimicrobiales bacterium]|nr:TonB-dependent receptor [Longimicrobiales bacterium]
MRARRSPASLPSPRLRTPAGVRAAVRLAATALLLLPGPARAQVPDTIPRDTLPRDTTIFRIEGIRVQASRPVTTVGGASAIEVTLDSLVLPPAATTEAVLREIPMLHLRTNSRGEAEVTVRGSESRQVAILMDGVPLTLGWDARTDVSILPAGAVSDVTVVRGLSTLLHGPNVLGGVVEMSVGRGERYASQSSLSATTGLDDAGGYGASVTGETPFATGGGQGVLRVGAGYRDSRGFPLPDGVSEPVPTGNDRRLNTDVETVNGFLAMRHRWDGGTWGSFSAASFVSERGIAAELGADDPRLWRYPDVDRTVLALSGGTGDRDTPLGRGDLEFSLGLDVGTTEIHSFATRAYRQVVGTEENDARTLTLRLLGDHTLGPRADLRASFTYSDINHDLSEDGAPDLEYEQHLFSLAGETVIRLLDAGRGPVRALRLTVGGAWDRATTPKTGGLPSLGTLDDWGARAGLSALLRDGGTLVHLGASRRGRFPSLRETYAESLNRFVPNPDLRPEHLTSVEGGVTTRLGSGELQVVGFRNELDGAIRRVTFPDRRRQRLNSDELTSTGLEVLFSQSFGAVSVGGDLTLQSVDLKDRATSVSSEPENMPEEAGTAWVRFPLVAGLTASGEVEYTGSQFCQDPNTGADVELDGGSWLNAGIARVWDLSSSRTLGRRLETRVSATNLADTALYDQCGLPRAGRLLQFQLRVF